MLDQVKFGMPRQKGPKISVERAQGPKRKTALAELLLTLVIAFLGSAAAQKSSATPRHQASSQTEMPAAANQHPPPPVKPIAEDDFHRRVAARWKAARKGQIQLYVIPDGTDPTKYKVRVVVTRAPSGSDGLTTVTPPSGATWQALLKLDDELRLRVVNESTGSLTIESLGHGPGDLIRHIPPGGHAEWIWNVTTKSQGSHRLLVQADVVYRRDFSPGGAPVVTYPSADTVITPVYRKAESPSNATTILPER